MSYEKLKIKVLSIKPYAEDIAIFISLLSLVFTASLDSRTNSLERTSNSLQGQSNLLQEQSNSLQEKLISIENNITDLQYEIHKITNFNTTIIGGERFLYLESTNFQYYKNSTLNYVILRGNLSTTVIIITPHYGRAELMITNFTRTKEIYRKGMEEYTEVKFWRQPQYLYTYQGLNTFKLDLPLACSLHPISYLIRARAVLHKRAARARGTIIGRFRAREGINIQRVYAKVIVGFED